MMTKIEELPNINEINSINIEDTSNTNNQTTSDLISKQNLDNIHSIILDLDNNPFKHIIVQNEIECFYSQINNCSIKERLVLTTLINLIKSNIAKKSKFLTYNDLINKTEDNNINNENNNICDYNDDLRGMKTMTPDEFRSSDYSYGIGECYKPNNENRTGVPDHFTMIKNNPFEEHNPGIGKYDLERVRPLNPYSY